MKDKLPSNEDRIQKHLEFVQSYSAMESYSNTELVVGRSICEFHEGSREPLSESEAEKLGLDKKDVQKYFVIRDHKIPLGSGKEMRLQNVVIDSRNEQGVSGKVTVTDEKGNFLELQLAGSYGTRYPTYSFNGQKLDWGHDNHPVMATLAQKWAQAMVLYPQATLDAAKRRQDDTTRAHEAGRADIFRKLKDIGLTDF